MDVRDLRSTEKRGRPRAPGVAVSLLAIVGVTLWAGSVTAELSEAVAYCVGCHGNEGMSMKLADGSDLDLKNDGVEFANSVHGRQLVCTDCHERHDEQDFHPSGHTYGSRREYAMNSYEVCKKCHFDTYARMLESVHYELFKGGSQAVPVCTDCHGSHNIQNPHKKRSMISRSCANCHVDIYAQYSKSVHGKALVEGYNESVPACADCHTAHRIVDPRTAKFRLSSPDTCVGCHANEELMARYEIPTSVATTYLADFHGVTASLSSASSVQEKQLVVACIDCHGVHDIVSPKLVGANEMKAKVARVCESCHKGAAEDFPSAWLSHYQPSLSHAPLAFIIDLTYTIFIPFVVGGLLLQVLLHLYRVAIRR